MSFDPTGTGGTVHPAGTKRNINVSFPYTTHNIASSADGSILYAVTTDIGVWATYDTGSTFTQIDINILPSVFYITVSCSTDGNTVLVCQYYLPSQLFVSRDAGKTWTGPLETDNTGEGYIHSSCCSSTGQIMYVLYAYGKVLKSTDYGESWAEVNNVGSGTTYAFSEISCSYDGQTVLIASGNGEPLLSTNGGTSFSTILTSGSWTTCAVSGNGSVLAVGENAVPASQFQISMNGGSTWTNYATQLDPNTTNIYVRTALSEKLDRLFAPSAEPTKYSTVTMLPYSNCLPKTLSPNTI
jgi:photosystem II stability/assembly factor-like uncharacterized protein